MSKRTRRNHASGFKAKVALAAIKGDKTLAEIAQQFDVHPNQVTEWKRQLQERAADVFDGATASKSEQEPDLKTLHAKIGQLTLENDFLGRRAHQGGTAERKEMIDRTHDLPVSRQCQILSLARSTAYYRPQATSEADLTVMRRIDELHLEHPFAGSRMLRDMLRREDHVIGRKHVATLMRKMGIEALYKKPRTSVRHAAHQVYPYLLRDLKIEQPDHVWCADITYIPMKRGFVYLFAVMDWASRRVLSWRLSNTLTTDFCLEAVQEAIDRYGKPQIFNTDQGSQFTSSDFTDLLKDNSIDISMDGKGCWRDNVFVERLWKSIKYEEVYLRAYETVSVARNRIGRYLEFYNSRRPHSALDGKTPDAFYFGNQSLPQAA
ncbi:IS3 family transposase [Noviherbaspirillum galbum]|uniref:IS3 family transposase n=1 Tax=Noviherbaspirillum galbum TaxID=2709383 RepID=A0A6B3SVN9_9BURK|nr:IS3 family transposase [Noviherbaspirillum galbum]NEX64571.1 IS3 family transposase [Noviherbaspirillum galbum]